MRMRAAEKRRKRMKRLQKRENNIHTNINGSKQKPIDFTIYAPVDFRVIENTTECLDFFRRLRQESSIRTIRNIRIVKMSLKLVSQIDYGTISILTAIANDFKHNNVILRGDFPKDRNCKEFIIESGFLDRMYDDNNKPFRKSNKSDSIFFETGYGQKLSNKDNINISNLIKKIVFKLTSQENHYPALKTIILEICGNSLEWSRTDNKQWLLGVKYESDKVVITITDVGNGILKTLHKKFSKKLTDIFTLKQNHEILMGAFERKYGSTSQEVNRNKGLPSIKSAFENNTIRSLKVLTNNVILHFDNPLLSKTFNNGTPWFKGTFYQWEITTKCIEKIDIKYD
jgi:hypothetical protein